MLSSAISTLRMRRRESRLDAQTKGVSEMQWLLGIVPWLGHLVWRGKAGFQAIEAGQYDHALRQWRSLARSGDSVALYQIGKLYSAGTGVTQSTEMAIRYFALAGERCHWRAKWQLGKLAKNGHTAAQYHYGRNMLLGCGNVGAGSNGVAGWDPKKGQRWLLKAAERGHPEAQVELARSYNPPFPPSRILKLFDRQRRDPSAALHWLREAMSRGSAEAEFVLGSSYMLGTGVEQDGRQGLRHIEAAAEKGVTVAQLCLASFYSSTEHDFVEPNEETSRKWFELAQSNVDPHSPPEVQLWMASALMEGKVTPGDRVQAYKWFKLATYKRGDIDILFGREFKSLRKSMTPAELTMALDQIEAALNEDLPLP